jgi:hypothetical protein
MLFAPTVVFASLLGVIQISGTGTCPTPEDVAQRLSALRPPETAQTYRARVDSTGSEVLIELRDAAGAVLASKSLKPTAPCADLAQAAALFVSAWAEQVQGTEPAGPALPPQLQPVPLVPPEPEGLRWELGVGAQLGGPPFAPGVLLDVALGSRHSSWAIGLELDLRASTRLPLGPGEFGYTPLSARVGPRFRLLLGPLGLDLGLSAVGGVYLLDGEGFDPDQSAHGGRGGASLELRLGWPLGPLRPWLAAQGTAWVQKTTVALRGSAMSTDLPQFEFTAALGVSFGP